MSEDEDGVVLKMQDTLEDRLIIFIQKFTKYFVDALKSQHLIAMREAKPNKNSSAGEGGKIQVEHLASSMCRHHRNFMP